VIKYRGILSHFVEIRILLAHYLLIAAAGFAGAALDADDYSCSSETVLQEFVRELLG